MQTDYTYSVKDNVITVIDLTTGGAYIINNIQKIAQEISTELNISYETFADMHLIYCNHRKKYNGVRFKKNHSTQFFSLNASNEEKALEYLKRVKAIHA